ncbi:DUF268 domain-containing protein [Aerolutibacter daejeonensis]|uniref:DUF268 domain-containing protein n=1 Tax=Aerolutibacter daejeonensis TaxID=346181 RepID=UPI00068BD783|nr:DUF268 domain-containing protein [Lysobacter daejeonensis]
MPRNTSIARKIKRWASLLLVLIRPSTIRNTAWFVLDYAELKRQCRTQANGGQQFLLYPCLNDRTTFTPVEPTYFFQDTWAARKIFLKKPTEHYDIGSSAKTIGIISQFVPTTMIDIRPIDLHLDGLNFLEGSILAIPAENDSLKSISSLCVVEHIGLGRYGDPIDATGSEKAAKELQRVLAVGGDLYFSVPVDDACKIYFNAHRAFTRDYIISLFDKLTLVDEKYHYGREMLSGYDAGRGFGTGLFHFTKTKACGPR